MSGTRRDGSRSPAHELPAWQRLARLAGRLITVPLRDLLDDADRADSLRVCTHGLLFDFSRQRVDSQALQALLSLAEQRDWQGRVHDLLEGADVNTTERRPALHTALRSPPGEAPDAAREVPEALSRIARFADAVRNGSRTGCTGKAFRDVVNIGIGGSDLGPRLVVDALQPHGSRPRLHFVANIDGQAISAALAGLNPETTLFVLTSKSFATLETRVNAETARSWFLERTGRAGAMGRHFVAVTANREAALAFGLPPENLFPLWDWVGGRYSLWSPAGLPAAIALGAAAFHELLRGAHAMDRHFRAEPAGSNAPLLAALLGVWNTNFLGAASHAVLPYDERLRLLPDYLQQLETESNGKRVRHDGSPVGVHTVPVLWGGTGTTGQHAFHQMLHQGTRSFSADFIVCAAGGHDLEDHRRWLAANALSQGKAMAEGNDAGDPHRAVPGNHATSTIVLDRLVPATLGALLAYFEHKVFCQGLVWDINSFDQWGVQLGKQLAETLFGQLAGEPTGGQDPSTRALIRHLIERGRA